MCWKFKQTTLRCCFLTDNYTNHPNSIITQRLVMKEKHCKAVCSFAPLTTPWRLFSARTICIDISIFLFSDFFVKITATKHLNNTSLISLSLLAFQLANNRTASQPTSGTDRQRQTGSDKKSTQMRMRVVPCDQLSEHFKMRDYRKSLETTESCIRTSHLWLSATHTHTHTHTQHQPVTFPSSILRHSVVTVADWTQPKSLYRSSHSSLSVLRQPTKYEV